VRLTALVERLGLGSASAVQIGRGLFDQIHAVPEQGAECGRIGQPLAELHEGGFALQTFRHT